MADGVDKSDHLSVPLGMEHMVAQDSETVQRLTREVIGFVNEHGLKDYFEYIDPEGHAAHVADDMVLCGEAYALDLWGSARKLAQAMEAMGIGEDTTEHAVKRITYMHLSGLTSLVDKLKRAHDSRHNLQPDLPAYEEPLMRNNMGRVINLTDWSETTPDLAMKERIRGTAQRILFEVQGDHERLAEAINPKLAMAMANPHVFHELLANAAWRVARGLEADRRPSEEDAVEADDISKEELLIGMEEALRTATIGPERKNGEWVTR